MRWVYWPPVSRTVICGELTMSSCLCPGLGLSAGPLLLEAVLRFRQQFPGFRHGLNRLLDLRVLFDRDALRCFVAECRHIHLGAKSIPNPGMIFGPVRFSKLYALRHQPVVELIKQRFIRNPVFW